MKKVIDVYGRECEIDETKQKLYSYCNRKKRIVWNAPMVYEGQTFPSYTDYEEEGTIDDLELKLKKWNNRLAFKYAAMVDFRASDLDPDQKIWKKFVEWVREHETDFFDSYGDFKKDFKISDEEIRSIVGTLD